MTVKGFLGAVVLACLAPATFELGCGGSDGSGNADQPNTGGALSTGGSTTTLGDGGTMGTGGALGSGGASGSGGGTATGGSSSTGGTDASGGVGASGYGGSSGSPTGGTTSRGGNSGAGGTGGASTANGGATGGATAGGGASGSGGSNGMGGSKGTGGATASGGASGSGGISGMGGSKGTGGVTANGGASGSGGTSGATGPVTTSCPGAAPSGITPTWCSCDQWGQTTIGNATYYNDIWGSGPGPQCIWVAGNQWGVAANHPNTSGVKAYPNISYSPGKVISAINTYTSSFDLTVPSSGAWEVAYDYWVKSGSTEIEIMLWVNYTQGKVFPAGSLSVSNVDTGGSTWNVYYGAYGGHDVVSLLRTTNANSGTVDILAITNWIITNKKSFNSSWTLDQVQFGPEIVSDGAVQSFVVNSFSVS